MGKKTKPKSPEQILAEKLDQRRKDFEAAGLDAETAELATYADVTVTRKGQKHGRTGAWRSNVFNLLLERKTIGKGHYDAALQLAEVWAVWKRLDGRPEGSGEYVDNAHTPPDQRCLVSDRQMRAGKDILWIMAQIQPVHVKLISAFMCAMVEENRAMSWRGIVERETAITVRERQTELVVSALEELRRVYQEPRERAA